MLIIVTFKVNGCMDNLATLKINYLAGKLKIKNMSTDDCHSVKKCLYSELFLSVFSRIQTAYGEIRGISLCSLQMRENTD